MSYNDFMNSVGNLFRVVVSFISYFLGALMSQPFAIVAIIVLLLLSKKGGVRVGKAFEASVGK